MYWHIKLARFSHCLLNDQCACWFLSGYECSITLELLLWLSSFKSPRIQLIFLMVWSGEISVKKRGVIWCLGTRWSTYRGYFSIYSSYYKRYRNCSWYCKKPMTLKKFDSRLYEIISKRGFMRDILLVN